MTSLKTEIVGVQQLRAVLNRVAEHASNAAPAMAGVAAEMLRQTEEIFAKEGRNVGLDHDWADLSDVTKHRRALAQSGGRQYGKNGRELKRYARALAGPMKILQVSGRLAASIQPTSNSHEAGLTTNLAYAATMFYGAKKGQFGTDRRNHPVPWGDIPGRPFFPVRAAGSGFRLTNQAERSVIEILEHYLDPL
ncbi:phage virion morphogenesis protein [Burkholderia sp. Ac-20345]|nr:phage virion morphogenesis protein [Burkholderia sp. Ac-20345]